jgi:peptidyl-prolyl cis-trans isomerase C
MRTFAASAEGRRLIAEQLVAMKALEQEGRKLGADRDPETVSQLALTRSNAAAGFALLKLVGEPTEADLHAAFEKEKTASGDRQVRHLLVSCGQSPVPSRSGATVPCEAALQKAQQVAASIHSRADFERAARAESDDTTSGAEGGLLGPLRPGSMPPEVEKVVFTLKPDEVSRPLQTQFGWHLFTVSAPEPPPFARVRPMLVQKWKQEKMKSVMEAARQHAKVELDPKYFGPAAKPARPAA